MSEQAQPPLTGGRTCSTTRSATSWSAHSPSSRSPSPWRRSPRLPGAAAPRRIGTVNEESPSRLIDARIKELGDWRGEMLSRLRTLVKEADPEVVEQWKWRGVPVWSHDGLICT